MDLVMNNLSPEEEPTEEDLQMMDALKTEIDKFLLEVKAGRA